MKKIYLFLLIMCSGIQVNGMDSQEKSEIAIDGLSKRDAQMIYESLERLSNKFVKGYDPNASQGKNSAAELSVFVRDLKDKTKSFPQLFAVVLKIEQAIEKNDGKTFWHEEANIRSLLRPTFRLPDNKKVKPVGWYEALRGYIFGKQKKAMPMDTPLFYESPKSQGYVAKVVGSVTGSISSFYNWLFSGQAFQVE